MIINETNYNDDELEQLDEELSADEVDFDAVRKVMQEIEAENQARLDAMTPEERQKEEERQRQIDECIEICDSIQERRIEREIEFSYLSPEETFAAYQKINENADKFAEEVGMESVSISNIKKNK